MDLFLKRAHLNDCDLLFNWANDKETRKNSFNQSKISYEEHVAWFNSKMKSYTCAIFILNFDNISVGYVRIDIENKTAVISYAIDENYRGRGLAEKMLALLEAELRNEEKHIEKLIGYVKSDNIASQKIFEKLKYNKIIHDDYFEYYKLLLDKVVI